MDRITQTPTYISLIIGNILIRVRSVPLVRVGSDVMAVAKINSGLF